MSTRPRLRREDPQRTAPVRNWRNLFRRSDSWSSETLDDPADPGGQPNGEHSWEKVVSHGVQLGYKIIDEQIQQGRRVAQAVRDRSYGAGAMGDDVSEVAERVLRFYTDLASLCFELIETVVRNPVVTGEAFRGKKTGPASPSNGESQDHGASETHGSMSVEVISTSPTQVSLDLYGGLGGSSPSAHALQALDASKPPLTDISFELDADRARPVLRINIPPGQPPDTYTGAVIDESTNRPLGTLCVCIRDPVAA